MTVPYASARSGDTARGEILKMLRRFGCTSVGFMDDFEKHELILAFTYRDVPVQLRANAAGWAKMFLDDQPWTPRRQSGKADYEAQALQQGMVAVNSILRDWIKGQTTAIECGILSFGQVFMPYMLTNSGQTVAEYVEGKSIVPLLSGPNRESK